MNKDKCPLPTKCLSKLVNERQTRPYEKSYKNKTKEIFQHPCVSVVFVKEQSITQLHNKN